MNNLFLRCYRGNSTITDSVSSFRDNFACQTYRKRWITASDSVPAGNQVFFVTVRESNEASLRLGNAQRYLPGEMDKKYVGPSLQSYAICGIVNAIVCNEEIGRRIL